jgi:hypothetical protein
MYLANKTNTLSWLVTPDQVVVVVISQLPVLYLCVFAFFFQRPFPELGDPYVHSSL